MSKGHDKYIERVGLISSLGKPLARRSGSCCELCLQCSVPLSPWEVPPFEEEPVPERAVFICDTCKQQIRNPKKLDANHWHCLHKTVWSEEPAVKVTALLVLHYLSSEEWVQALLEQVYLSPEESEWVDSALEICQGHL